MLPARGGLRQCRLSSGKEYEPSRQHNREQRHCGRSKAQSRARYAAAILRPVGPFDSRFSPRDPTDVKLFLNIR
jgi:hypothetical protein